MPNEWFFYFNKNSQTTASSEPSAKVLDLAEYQNFLLQLKTEFEDKFKPEDVEWCDVNSLPPPDNVFARFKLTCISQQVAHQTEMGPEHPSFSLYWTLDPKTYDPKKMNSNLHSKCYLKNAFDLRLQMFVLQRRIVEKFPDHFILYKDDSDTRYDSRIRREIAFKGMDKGQRGLYYADCPHLQEFVIGWQ